MLDALTSVEVTHDCERRKPSGFQLTFALEQALAAAHALPAAGGAPPPLMRVIVIVTVNGMPDVLMDGVVTQAGGHARQASRRKSTLTVTGEDLSA